jgi:hypothetical protein
MRLSQNNPTTIVTITLAIGIATGMFGALVSTNFYSEVFGQNEKFTAKLTGQEEVPPVDTKATGMAEFTPKGESVEYKINATGIQNVTEAHIHSGEKGENGLIVVTLFMSDPPQNNVSKNAIITADKLRGPMEGKTISDLAAAMKNGSTYANIHTDQKPNGEIRGQIMSTK